MKIYRFLTMVITTVIIGPSGAYALSCNVNHSTSLNYVRGSVAGPISPETVDVSPEQNGIYTSGDLSVELKLLKRNLVVQASVGTASKSFSGSIERLDREIVLDLQRENSLTRVILNCN